MKKYDDDFILNFEFSWDHACIYFDDEVLGWVAHLDEQLVRIAEIRSEKETRLAALLSGSTNSDQVSLPDAFQLLRKSEMTTFAILMALSELDQLDRLRFDGDRLLADLDALKTDPEIPKMVRVLGIRGFIRGVKAINETLSVFEV